MLLVQEYLVSCLYEPVDQLLCILVVDVLASKQVFNDQAGQCLHVDACISIENLEEDVDVLPDTTIFEMGEAGTQYEKSVLSTSRLDEPVLEIELTERVEALHKVLIA